jgi:hypothetical protein
MNLKKFSKDQRFALLYGILLGDGCLSRYKTKDGRERFAVCITGDFYSDGEFYKKIIVSLLNSFSEKKVIIQHRPKNGTLSINLLDQDFFKKISSLGFPIGKKGNVLKLPSYFYENGLVSFVISGYFSTDGCIVLTKNPNKYYPRLEGHGIAPNLIKQISDYLNLKGLNGHFYECKRTIKDPRWKTAQQQYRFQFNGEKNLKNFKDLIGFVNPKHKKRYGDFLRYSVEYDLAIKQIPTQKQKPLREKINKKHNMALPSADLGTSGS